MTENETRAIKALLAERAAACHHEQGCLEFDATRSWPADMAQRNASWNHAREQLFRSGDLLLAESLATR